MARNIVILGAGASVSAGAPLMFDFLDQAERVLRNNETAQFGEDFARVFNGVHQLEHVLSKAVVDVNNLEAVFGAFEMAKLAGKLGTIEETELDLLAESLQKVILRTLECTVRFKGDRASFRPPAGYGNLAKQLSTLKDKDLTFFTFNYDLGLDCAVFQSSSQDPYYGFAEKIDGSRTVLKLHGSMHWYRDQAQQLTSIPLASLIASPWVKSVPGSDWSTLIVSEKLKSLGDRTPFIVPPSWKKGDLYSDVSVVWKLAAKELSEAECILICGFSLPETDQYFRYLYALGTAGPTRLKKIVVFDPSESVGSRFKALFGQTALQRYTFRKEMFDKFVDNLPSLLVD